MLFKLPSGDGHCTVVCGAATVQCSDVKKNVDDTVLVVIILCNFPGFELFKSKSPFPCLDIDQIDQALNQGQEFRT